MVWDQHTVTTLTFPSIEETYTEYAIICNKVSFLPRQLLTFSCERHSAHLPETKSNSRGSDISPCPLSAWFQGFLLMPTVPCPKIEIGQQYHNSPLFQGFHKSISTFAPYYAWEGFPFYSFTNTYQYNSAVESPS